MTVSGVYLILRGEAVSNNSAIPITNIGTDSNNPDVAALQCVTDLTPCCRQEGNSKMAMGEWYFPDGTQVPGDEVPGTGFFRTRGSNDGTISMFRTDVRVLSPVGMYCCEIPDSNGVNVTLCADISKFNSLTSTLLLNIYTASIDLKCVIIVKYI